MKPLLALVLLSGLASAEPQTLDLVTFTAPSGWSSAQQGDHVELKKVANGEYCIIGVYMSVAATGDPVADFQSEWSKIYAQPLGAGAAPTPTQADLPGGVKMLVGNGAGSAGGMSFLGVLFTYDTGERVTSILVLAPSDKAFGDFAGDLQRFLASVSVKGAERVAPPAEQPGTMINGTRWPAPPAKLTAKDLAGEWKYGAGTAVVSAETGAYNQGRSFSYAVTDVFDAKGGYKSSFSGMQGYSFSTQTTTGKFSVDNAKQQLILAEDGKPPRTYWILGWISNAQGDAMLLLDSIYDPKTDTYFSQAWERAKAK